jgi:hypothetical protein
VFLDAYLPYSYGRAGAERIRSAARSLLHELHAQPPRVTAAFAPRGRPRLVSVRAKAATNDARVLVRAVVDDGPRRYGIPLEVREVAGGWLITTVGN